MKKANSFNSKTKKDLIQLMEHKLLQNCNNNRRENFLFIFQIQFSQTR